MEWVQLKKLTAEFGLFSMFLCYFMLFYVFFYFLRRQYYVKYGIPMQDFRMDVTNTFCEVWQHRLQGKNRSCVFFMDEQLRHFARLCNRFEGITRQRILDSGLHPHLVGYLFALHRWHLTH